MGTLASQPEIVVWVRAQGALVGARGYHSRENFEIVYAKSCNPVHLFNNGNGVPTRSPRNDT